MNKISLFDKRLLEESSSSDEQLNSFLKRRLAGEPVAKIIGKKGFWKEEFIVSKDVLDPRPDSETLIEAVLAKFPDQTKSLSILDLGTGSGCLLLSLLGEYPKARGIGIDISEKALTIANQNKGDKKAEFIQRDMRQNLSDLGHFDIMISNPPYIPTEEIQTLEKDVKEYDPLLALDGGTDGLDFYRALAKQHLALHLFIEIGKDQEKQIIPLFENNGWHFVQSWKDLGGITRVLYFKS